MTFVHRSAAATERRWPNEALHCSRILLAAVLHAGRAMQLLPDDGNISYRLELPPGGCHPGIALRSTSVVERPEQLLWSRTSTTEFTMADTIFPPPRSCAVTGC